MDSCDIIYPTNINKYHGSILIRNNKSNITYTVIINSKGLKYRKVCESYEVAIDVLKQYNIVNNLVKNCIYDRGDHYELILNKNCTMLFDKDDLDLINDNVIWALHDSYAHCIGSDGKLKMLHRMIYEKHNGVIQPGLVIDHISNARNIGLDNRKQNIRLATYSLNCRNSRQKPGISGMINIYQISTKSGHPSWQVRFKYNAKSYSKQLRTLHDAKEWLHSKQHQLIPIEEMILPNRIQ